MSSPLANLKRSLGLSVSGWYLPIPWAGWAVVWLLTAFLASRTHPELWLLPSWPGGGDIASHILPAARFQEWFLEHGRISGWMPENFAGFPAFTYYFPFPFLVITLTSLLVELPLAFKWMAILPAFALPTAICWSTGVMGWFWPARLLATTATVGFLLNEGNALWGGNLPSLFSGEFAYSWGLLAVILFMPCLERLRYRGGAGWFLAALLAEMVAALSHGIAILMVGFGSFFYLLLSRGNGGLWWIFVRLHLLAFLLLGFWLVPLLANLPWVIPNDRNYWVASQGFDSLWPHAFRWVWIGLPAWLGWMFREAQFRSAVLPFLAMGLVGVLGFIAAPWSGLADVRFLPFTQLSSAVVLAGALGWWMQHGCRIHAPVVSSRATHAVAMLFSVVMTLLLVLYWNVSTGMVKSRSAAYFSGYEGMQRWPLYRQLADHLRGGLASPRVLSEQNLANGEIGGNRALEALPLFGSRPVLDGLYMESAISAPFVYQLQDAISTVPHRRVARYPALESDITKIVNHMGELAVDTLILRAPETKKRFSEDDRFQKEAEIGPFLLLRLRTGTPSLLELLAVPLQAETRREWLERAFSRFLTQHPYPSRMVFLQEGEEMPTIPPHCGGGTARMESLQRERMVITTDRPGCPLMVRMSYHPKWRSLSGEPVYLVEPFFMLLFPRTERLELAYLPHEADRLGGVLTLFGLLLLLLLVIPGRLLPAWWRVENPPLDRKSPGKPSVFDYGALLGGVGMGLLLGLGWYFSPNRAYQAGHALIHQLRFTEAAPLLDQAAQERRGWARRAEALYWAGLAWDLGGGPLEAAQRYQTVLERYPASRLAPEVLYRLIVLYRKQGDRVRARTLQEHLAVQYPGSRWLTRSQNAAE
ncbi:MAG: tetratricopeptide repeat protein [Magnetococcales bacterium]|nr:tetratricopeptide repeat protein [Magnetococcales bacterium]